MNDYNATQHTQRVEDATFSESQHTQCVESVGDYISRQLAIEICNDELLHAEDYSPIRTWNRIMQLPSARPEIIRCKDCVEWDSDSEWCNRHGGTMQENDFCSRAERRTDETDYRKE